MTFKESFIKSLTPAKTEEVKPGLFIQERKKGYRQIDPMAWDGKIRWKAQMKSVFSIRTFIWIAIIFFIAYSYSNDNQQLIDFYNYIHENPIRACNEIIASLQTPECTPFQQENGLCFDNFGLDVSTINETFSHR